MKATWGIAAALLLVVAGAMDTSARGRGGKQGFHGHGKRSEHKGSLIEQLSLTEDQQTQLQTLKEEIQEQGQTLGEQYRTDFEAILTDEQRETLAELKNPLGLTEDQQTQIEALKEQDLTKEQFRTSFEAILTDEQIQTLEERKANRSDRSGLGLTQDQQTQIQALKDQDLTKEEFRTSFEAILTDEQLDALSERKTNRGQHGKRGKHRNSPVEQLGLTQDQQTQIEDLREGLQEQKQALREEYWTDFEAILTADQLVTLEAIKANRGNHSKDSEEETETDAAGKTTAAVEETSWGRVKDSFGR